MKVIPPPLLIVMSMMIAPLASSHTVEIMRDNALRVTPSMLVHGTNEAEHGFYMTTGNAGRVYNRVGSSSYGYQKSNGDAATYQGYWVTITANDPVEDSVMAYYPYYGTVYFGAAVTGGGSGGSGGADGGLGD